MQIELKKQNCEGQKKTGRDDSPIGSDGVEAHHLVSSRRWAVTMKQAENERSASGVGREELQKAKYLLMRSLRSFSFLRPAKAL